MKRFNQKLFVAGVLFGMSAGVVPAMAGVKHAVLLQRAETGWTTCLESKADVEKVYQKTLANADPRLQYTYLFLDHCPDAKQALVSCEAESIGSNLGKTIEGGPSQERPPSSFSGRFQPSWSSGP
mgnify:CR=1 FL=1